MSTILTVYSSRAFKRFLLPAVKDADTTVLIAENLFEIADSIELGLENVDGQWHFLSSEDYELRSVSGDVSVYDSSISELISQGQSTFLLLQNGLHILSIVASISNEYFSEYEFFLSGNLDNPVYIGKENHSTISYDFRGTVSKDHAVLFRNGSDIILQDNSANGTFVNNRRVEGSVRLAYGDCIDIFGLRIVFLGEQIAVNVRESGAQVDRNRLQTVSVNDPPVTNPNHKSLKTIFHRSPRRLIRMEEDEIKIDDPPAPKEELKRQGVLNVIGASLSMALPMLLGCSFMVFASRVSGMNRGIFMYVGMVTAVASAIIGMIRGISAMRTAKQEYEAYEKLRNERYGAYLQKQESIIREKYEKAVYALRDQYLSAAECCSYSETTPTLWNRNAAQADFLKMRLGIGDLPFSVKIRVPEQKFSMTDNNLLEIPENIRRSYEILRSVPVCVDLLQEQLIGVIGGHGKAGAVTIVMDMIAQLAANTSYTDVKIAIVYDEKRQSSDSQWNFVRLLPHVWNESRTFRYVASNKEEASDVFFELARIMRERLEEKGTGGIGDHNEVPKPYYVLILIDPELMEGEMISRYVLNPQSAQGLTAVFMTQSYEELPNECSFIIENDESYSGIYHTSDDFEGRTAVAFDEVGQNDIEAFASRIASVSVRELETGGDIPDSISFLEMYDVNFPADLDVIARWKKNRTYESMRALIGHKAGGAPCYLDIHEKYHGPHGLVAGTTGSGKSETLQTYILSLAINYSPDDVAFFIIDYKGGGMANLFSELPHMIGQISNLSGNQVNRALVSIQSEKDRREALFAEYGVKDIRDYTRLYKNNEATIPLPHLIIVIDEFAEMKTEEPEFIQEIVSVSRVGRSLGIHLIMATQKPAGSVSDDIWANSRFKLCLRVQSKQDSMDMLHKPDAAYLTRSGRSYLQVGNDELYELFQSGFSGAVYYDDESARQTDVAKMLTGTGKPVIEGTHTRILIQREKKRKWIQQLVTIISRACPCEQLEKVNASRDDKMLLAKRVFRDLKNSGIDYAETDHNRENLFTLFDLIVRCGMDTDRIIDAESAFTNAKEKLPQQPEKTQLEAVVAHLKAVAEQNGYDHDFSLFLPLLPEEITIDALPGATSPWSRYSVFDGNTWPGHEKYGLAVGMGLYDDPENQRQDAFVFDFAADGNLLVLGAVGTGKTTFLQTLTYGLVNQYSPDEVNIYAIEFSAKKFSAFEGMPHVGGLIRENDDTERIDKFFTMLSRMLAERKQLLGERSFVQYHSELGVKPLPAVVVLIDNFAALVNKVNDRYQSTLMQLTKEGVGNGIYLAVTATGTGSSEIPNSLAQNFRNVVCLELNNAYDYANYLRTSRLKLQPESNVSGRGLTRIGDRILEFQTVLPVSLEMDASLSSRLAELGSRMRDAWRGETARTIPEVPENPIWDDFVRLQGTRTMLRSDRFLPLGYDTRLAEPFGIDLSQIYTWLITGAKKKGKTWTLKLLMRSAAARGGKVIVIDFNGGLRGFAHETGAEYIGDIEVFAGFIGSFLRGEVLTRNKFKGTLLDRSAEEETIYREMQQFKQIFFFVDDLVTFIDKVTHAKGDNIPENLTPNMEMIMEKGSLHNFYWFATVNKEDIGTVSGNSLYRLFTRDKKGIHMGGAVHATALPFMSFDNHDRRTADNLRPAGRGMLPAEDETTVTEVAVPAVKGGAQ